MLRLRSLDSAREYENAKLQLSRGFLNYATENIFCGIVLVDGWSQSVQKGRQDLWAWRK